MVCPLFIGDIIGLHPVEYVKNPITDWFIEKSKIAGPLLPFNDFITSLIVKLLISKDVCWKYEKEGRVIAKTQGLKKFGNSALQQVCFGLRTPESDKKLINQILNCHGYNVSICKMVRNENDFGLEVKEI